MLPDRLVSTEEVRVVHLSLESPPLPSTPEQALHSFAEALGSCDLDARRNASRAEIRGKLKLGATV